MSNNKSITENTIMVSAMSVMGVIALAFYIAIGVLFSHIAFGPLNYSDPVDLSLIVLWPVVLVFWAMLIIGGIVVIWMVGETIWDRCRDFYFKKKRGRISND